jgi:Zn-dependent M28 family amino/carboxypeptidase
MRSFLLLVCLVAVAPLASAQPIGDVQSRAMQEADMRFLASDELMGRRAGTPWDHVAARYIAEQLRAAGVSPVTEAGYFQPFALPDGAESQNVLGVIPGTDPELRDEYVMLLAHYDHVGAGDHGGGMRPTTEADSIYNGARDNGMGVVALLHAARSLAADPPARSIVLFAAGAEEMGLVGSRFYAEHPLVPLEQTVFALNVDTGGYSDTSAVTVVGLERTTAAPLIREGAARAGLGLTPQPDPRMQLFRRSDNINLARRGIPAPTFSPGFLSFSDPGVADYYHQVTDEVGDLDFAYLARFADAYAQTARLIADAPERPRWADGDEFEAAGRTLYGD